MLEERNVKIVFLGDASVGKTSIINAYVGDPEEIQSTVGAASKIKIVEYNGIRYKLELMDTAGQERYRTIVPMYLRGASAAVLVMDVSKENSLDSIDYWVNFIRENGEGISILVLCCNKIDLPERIYDIRSIQEKANEHQLTYFETSCISKVGIFNLFEYIISNLDTIYTKQPVTEKLIKNNKNESSCC